MVEYRKTLNKRGGKKSARRLSIGLCLRLPLPFPLLPPQCASLTKHLLDWGSLPDLKDVLFFAFTYHSVVQRLKPDHLVVCLLYYTPHPSPSTLHTLFFLFREVRGRLTFFNYLG